MQESGKMRKWQNLVQRKCPNCDTDLQDSRLYLRCPKPAPDKSGRDCFFIKREKAIEMLLDHRHPANIYLTDEERDKLDEVVKTLNTYKT